jgi:hypothetical protein
MDLMHSAVQYHLVYNSDSFVIAGAGVALLYRTLMCGRVARQDRMAITLSTLVAGIAASRHPNLRLADRCLQRYQR